MQNAPSSVCIHGIARVENERGETPEPGTPGELLIGGALVARGCYQQPSLTAEKFVERQGIRYFRTGDIASMHPDSSITCYGRADEQLKIRGFRIEPGEVESVVCAHPGVRSATVTWLPAADTSRLLVAVYVAVSGDPALNDSISTWIAERLPAHMVPSKLLRIDQLPLTANGKVDRPAIRRLFEQEAERAADSFEAPATATEKTIAATWCSILKLGSVSRSDHFFSIGGDSLAAVKVITSIESTFGLRLTFRSVYEAP